jgi:hypothetical protein
MSMVESFVIGIEVAARPFCMVSCDLVGVGSTMVTRVVEPAPLGDQHWGKRK